MLKGVDERLIRAVLADPDDDLPKLVFADWLDENVRDDVCRACLGLKTLTYASRTPLYELGIKTIQWIEGRPFWAACNYCQGTGEGDAPNGYALWAAVIRDGINVRPGWYGNTASQEAVQRVCQLSKRFGLSDPLSCGWRSGFVTDLAGTFEQVTVELNRLTGGHPVVRLRLSDRSPSHMAGRWRWFSQTDPFDTAENSVPMSILLRMLALVGYELTTGAGPCSGAQFDDRHAEVEFRSRADAFACLTHVMIDEAREATTYV